MQFQIFIRLENGMKLSLDFDSGDICIEDVKQALIQIYGLGSCYLFFCGKYLKDLRTLHDYNIGNGSFLDVKESPLFPKSTSVKAKVVESEVISSERLLSPIVFMMEGINWKANPIEILLSKESKFKLASEVTECHLKEIVQFIKHQFSIHNGKKYLINQALFFQTQFSIIVNSWANRTFIPLLPSQNEFLYQLLTAECLSSRQYLGDYISSLYSRKALSDIILFCENGSGKGLKAHKFILWSRVPELRPLLKDSPSSLNVHGIHSEEMLEFLVHIVYKDQVPRVENYYSKMKQLRKYYTISPIQKLFSPNVSYSSLHQEIAEACFSDEGAEVTIHLESGTQVVFHKLVLLRSQFFEALFSFNAPSQPNVIPLYEVPDDTFLLIKKWMYGCELTLNVNNVISLLVVAGRLILKELVFECRQFLIGLAQENESERANLIQTLEEMNHPEVDLVKENLVEMFAFSK